MALDSLRVRGYRSLRDLRLEPVRTTVVVGSNGCGKSNLYRALWLLQCAAAGQLASTLVEEGGMPSVLWAGPTRRQEPRRVILEVAFDDFEFRLEAGITSRGTPERNSLFRLDPELKHETLAFRHRGRRTLLAERRGPSLSVRDASGRRRPHDARLDDNESLLSQLRDAASFPELAFVRDRMLGWRFYHSFRTDASSPLRQPRTGALTPVLSQDGHDLAAALQTIREIGSAEALAAAVSRAFPGGKLLVREHEGRLEIALATPDLPRPLAAHELSDGTLRYLCLLAALLTPRPPELMVFNEPETSLHPDLLLPLAELIASASTRSQLWIATHSRELAGHLARLCEIDPVELELVAGETRRAGAGLLG
jgi:predicted ATPase